MMKVTVIDSDSWTFVQRGEDVVDLYYLSHVYVTTLFIRHFNLILFMHVHSGEQNVSESLMLCKRHGSG